MAGRVNVLQGTCDEDLPVLAATDKVRRELLERHQAAGARRMERRRALRRQRNDGRKRSGVACRGRDLAATLRYRSPPRPPGEGSTTGTAQRALALEPRRFRYAYRTGHAARRGDVTRSIENRMDTITSMALAREDAPFSLRTSRTNSINFPALNCVATETLHRKRDCVPPEYEKSSSRSRTGWVLHLERTPEATTWRQPAGERRGPAGRLRISTVRRSQPEIHMQSGRVFPSETVRSRYPSGTLRNCTHTMSPRNPKSPCGDVTVHRNRRGHLSLHQYLLSRRDCWHESCSVFASFTMYMRTGDELRRRSVYPNTHSFPSARETKS